MNPEPMPPSSTEELVGRKLRSLRLALGLSLRALAARSGLNINTLVLIEKGKSSPSVSTLQQLAQALEIPITKFFESETVEKSIVFTQASKRLGADIGSALMENLGKDLRDNAVQPFFVTLKPGVASGDHPTVHSGHEFIYCLSGEIFCQVVEEIFTLHPGDSLLFQAHLPHCWKNNGTENAKMLLVFFPAEKGEQPGKRHFSPAHLKRDINLKVAVISEDGENISKHFGRAPFYIVYTIEGGKIINKELRGKASRNQYSKDNDHSKDHGVDEVSHENHIGMGKAISDCEAIICGGMGKGALERMRKLNIQPVVTGTTDAEAAVRAYIDGKLVDQTEKLP